MVGRGRLYHSHSGVFSWNAKEETTRAKRTQFGVSLLLPFGSHEYRNHGTHHDPKKDSTPEYGTSTEHYGVPE